MSNEPTDSSNPYADDPVPAQPVPSSNTEDLDGTGGLIPYKNPKALTAYYLGIVSGIPFIGLPFGIAAFVLGLQGLKAKKENPAVKGSVHAGIGIGCGLIFTLVWSVSILAIIAALVSQA